MGSRDFQLWTLIGTMNCTDVVGQASSLSPRASCPRRKLGLEAPETGWKPVLLSSGSSGPLSRLFSTYGFALSTSSTAAIISVRSNGFSIVLSAPNRLAMPSSEGMPGSPDMAMILIWG